MKSISVNRLFCLGLIAVLSACHYTAEESLYSGTWKYVSVKQMDTTLFSIEENDFLSLRTDSSFEYSIASINKRKSGKWAVDASILTLRYTNPDTIRTFEIDIVSKYRLQFHEGNTVYDFKRIQ